MPLKFHKDGYNCSEAILKAVNEEKNLKIPVAMATPFGSGMGVGGPCGAVTGAVMVLGSIYGREDSTVKSESGKHARTLIKELKEKYGTIDCKALKAQGVSCQEIIEVTYDMLNEHI